MFSRFKGKRRPWVGVSLMPTPDFFQAAQPLFESGAVEGVEWSFDMGWGGVTLPDWLPQVLDFFSRRDRLIGHGVTYSLLSARWEDAQDRWLTQLRQECQRYRYRHISEHFGWMAAGNFVQSAPLPLPLTLETLRLGRDRLKKLANAAKVPIGLENLAFAFNLTDVLEQGTFLDQLLAPVNGFLVLDLHNLYCQIHNFNQSPLDLLQRYPLHCVRQLHVSGGSWSMASPDDSRIRRDTHDDCVPEAVFELLAIALPLCPHLESVIFERMGNTLLTAADQVQWRQDFERIQQIVSR